MARTSIEQKAIEKAETIGRLIGISQTNVIGCLILLWNRSQDQGLEIVDRQWIDRMALHSVRRKSIRDAFVSQLVAMRILDDEGNMTYRIKGNKKHIEGLKTFKSQTKKAREMKKLKHRNRLREVEKVIHNSVEIPLNDKLWLQNWDGIEESSRENTVNVFSDDTTFGVFEGHSEVIHIDDGKALPVAKVDEKNKQELFEKNSVNRAVDSYVDRKQLQYLCANESESEKTFYKKSPEEREKHNGVDSRYKGNSLSHSEFLIILKIWDSERGLMIPALNSDKMCQMLMKTRWEQNPSEEFWRGVVSKMASSHFLTGSKGFKATLEWTLRPGNLEKVLSGVYDNAPIPGQELHPDTLAMIARVTANEQAEAAAIAQKKLDQDRRNLEKQNKTQSGGLMKAGSLMGEVMNKIGEQARRTR